jgi:uncharacterized protein YgiM (DUF1202 family)
VGFLTRVGPIILALGLVSCESRPKRATPIGEAFAGPALLKIRRDIPLESPVVATVKHGEHLELLQRRRRFFRVRVPSGVEGWTDERQLLAKDDMDKLRDLAKRAAKMPPQGQATAFGELNVHTQPARQSPSFLQIKENEKVEVLTHLAAPRTDLTRKALLPPPPKKAKSEKKAAKESRYPPLAPPPQPPGPPANWLELSQTDLPLEEASEEAASEKEAKPVPVDDWSLIRTPNGESGWVLTRRLVMAIPDEVAQYAEGHRIVSYFSLGEVADGNKKKANWLWTTIGLGNREYDFDSFRVFVWSLRRHRYETAYIERNLRGYAPVLLEQVELASSTKTKSDVDTKFPGFSLCIEKKDGQRVRRSYAFLTNIVRYAGEQPCSAAPLETAQPGAPLPSGSQPQRVDGFLDRVRARVRRLFRR